MSTIIDHDNAWVQTRTQGIFDIPIPFGSGGAAKVGVEITPLSVTITPIKAGNFIELSFYIFGMGHQPSIPVGYFLRRNGVQLTDTTDFSDNYYANNTVSHDGGSAAGSVPQVNTITLFDRNSLDVSSEYVLVVRLTSSDTASDVNFYLNRTREAPSTSGREEGVSTTIITEYDL